MKNISKLEKTKRLSDDSILRSSRKKKKRSSWKRRKKNWTRKLRRRKPKSSSESRNERLLVRSGRPRRRKSLKISTYTTKLRNGITRSLKCLNLRSEKLIWTIWETFTSLSERRNWMSLRKSTKSERSLKWISSESNVKSTTKTWATGSTTPSVLLVNSLNSTWKKNESRRPRMRSRKRAWWRKVKKWWVMLRLLRRCIGQRSVSVRELRSRI